jgi:serine acetyltransferase
MSDMYILKSKRKEKLNYAVQLKQVLVSKHKLPQPANLERTVFVMHATGLVVQESAFSPKRISIVSQNKQ